MNPPFMLPLIMLTEWLIMHYGGVPLLYAHTSPVSRDKQAGLRYVYINPILRPLRSRLLFLHPSQGPASFIRFNKTPASLQSQNLPILSIKMKTFFIALLALPAALAAPAPQDAPAGKHEVLACACANAQGETYTPGYCLYIRGRYFTAPDGKQYVSD
jgi:hypothetical protein